MKKREHYISFLKKVDILKNLSDYEIGQITDAIRTEKISKGTEVITQGEIGDKFYFLEEGNAIAYKKFDDNPIPKEVMKYKEGQFFGELALMKGDPRAATVICETDCVYLTLDRLSFKRLLGPLEILLKKTSDGYKKN